MDKNKSRTDMLAAGRKKLQQYRKKKDGKGNKNMGKGDKPEQDADADAASSAANTVDVKPPVSGGEGSGSDIPREPVDTSSLQSAENSVGSSIGQVNSERLPGPKFAETGKSPKGLREVVEFLRDVKEAVGVRQSSNVSNDQDVSSSDQNGSESSCAVDTDTTKSSSEIPEIVGSEGKSDHVSVSAPVDLFAPNDSHYSGEKGDAEIEVKHAPGVDQEARHSDSEQIDRSRAMEPEGDRRVAISGSDESAETDKGADLGHVDTGGAFKEVEQISNLHDQAVLESLASDTKEVQTDESHSDSAKSNPHEVSASVASSIEFEEVPKADKRPDFSKTLIVSDEGSAVSGQLIKEDMTVGSSSGENSKMSKVCSDFGNLHAGEVHKYILEKSAEFRSQSVSGDNIPFTSLDSKMISWPEGSLVSLSQLAEVVHGLGEDEFSFLLSTRESANRHTNGPRRSRISNVLETLEEQLYLTSFVKDLYQIQLTEQLKTQTGLDHQHHRLVNEFSAATESLNKARGKNESLALELGKCTSELQVAISERGDLQKELQFVKAELEEISTRSAEIHGKLEMSQHELGNTITDLADCRRLVADLQVENGNLNERLTSVTEERNKFAEENASSVGSVALITAEKLKLEEEKEYYLSEYREALTELADYKALAESCQLEREKLEDELKGILASFTEEKEHLVDETEKLSTDLIGYKVTVEILEKEISNLNKSFASLTEEQKRLSEEKDNALNDREKLSTELAACKSLMAGKQLESDEVFNNLKESALRLEQLTEENSLLTSNLDIYKGKITEFEMKTSFQSSNDQEVHLMMEQAGPNDDDSKKSLSLDPVLERSLSDDGNTNSSPLGQLTMDVYDDTYGFVSLRGHLEQAGKMLQKLDKAIKNMHSDSLRRSTNKAVAPAVSKLIQAFESHSHTDDLEAEDVPSAENQSHADLYAWTSEQAENLKTILKKLSVDVENASDLFKSERNGKVVADSALKELKAQHDALQRDSYNLDEAKIELLVLYELIKQHLCNVQSKKDELFLLHDTLRQQNFIAKVENEELGNRLNAYKSRINDLQGQLDKLQQNSSEVNSSIHVRMDMLQKEVSDRTLILEQDWSNVLSWLANAVEKLDAYIDISHSSYLTDTNDVTDIGRRVVASFEGATKMIGNLKEKLDGARSDCELTCSSYKVLNEKFNDLHGQHELATDLLRKIYASLRELVNGSSVFSKESEADIEIEKLVDPWDTLIEQMRKLLEERSSLKSLINEMNTDVTDKTNKIEELQRRCFGPDAIVKLVRQVEDVVNLEGFEIDMDEPASVIESLSCLFVQRVKEADDIATSCREKLEVREKTFNELHTQVDHIITMFVHCENESFLYKESLKSAMEDLVALSSEMLNRVAECEQSEQKVSSLREKLSIAVAKGKGLIVQRDGLKHSLAEKCSELERCLEELQSRDSQLVEVETKLKTYSEAGERVEALESELSYIRNSATALRESFLLKDSVIHRIEEILEDLELPEHFHARDIVEKIDWLANSAANSLLPADWDQKSGGGEGIHMDAWREDLPTHTNSENELIRKYDELQSKFYALAEQNEMLEQSLMERNNLVQRWEEILDKINMPPQLRSMEPEDRIEWLGGALSEAVHRCESLQQQIDNVETFCGTISVDLEESQKRASSLEEALQSVVNEKEHLSTNLEILIHDNNIVSEKADVLKLENDKLQDEVGELQDKLKALQVVEERNRHIDCEIKRFQDLLSDILQDYDVEQSLGAASIEYLEHLLTKLIQKYSDLSAREVVPAVAVDEHMEGIASATLGEKTQLAYAEDQGVATLKLGEAAGELARAKEDIAIYMEKNQTLIHEVEKLDTERLKLQELLNQEEQKSASVREKLNMAVRKGKSLVQQRDSMRQTIDELTSEAERLKSELRMREAALSEYEQKIKDYQETVEGVECKSFLLENRLAETERDWKDKKHTVGAICSALDEIDLGSDYSSNDPVNKITQISKVLHGLQASTTSFEHEANKSRRAAELLLAELNEVQERNDGLQDELAKATTEVSELVMEKNLAETAKHDALVQVENLNALLSEKSYSQFADFAALKPYVHQLQNSFCDFSNLLHDALSNDLEFVHNLAASLKSSSKSADRGTGGGPTGIVPFIPVNEVAPVQEESLSVTSVTERREDQFDNNTPTEICEFFESNLKDLMIEISVVKEKLYKHSSSLHEEAKNLSEIVGTIHKEMRSQYEYYESTKGDMFRLESIEKQKDTEIMVLRRDFSLLFEACKSSVAEIRNWKAQLAGKGLALQDQEFNYEFPISVNEGDLLSGQTISASGFVGSMADELVLAVKKIVSAQNEIAEIRQMELKTEITNLQTELQEKNIEKEKNCLELVNQIKEAESTSARYLQELQSSHVHMHELERKLDVMEKEHSLLQKMVEELNDRESTYIHMQERVKSLTDIIAAKEQENEAVMQALDEEESQMEDLKSKLEELQNVVHQKNLDLKNAEASLGKTSKKLSVTVNKFDELHSLSERLLSEVEKLQSQLHDRDSEVSFLRQEVTRCTNDAIAASQMNKTRNADEIHDLLLWLDSLISQVLVRSAHYGDNERDQGHDYKEIIKKQIMAIMSELEDQRAMMQSKDSMLRLERNRVEELMHKGESLEKALQEKESQLTIIQGVENSVQGTSIPTEAVETESAVNKWAAPASSRVPQVRSLRKSNNDQVAISVDMDPGGTRELEDEDDDKAHGFKSLTTSKVVPRFTRPVTDLVDGLWVSCDRALMRQPTLRIGLIIYWVMMHALLATFAV